MRLADVKLISTAPGMTASATNASCQFSTNSTVTAMTNRMTEIDGDTIAICNRPVVESTSPESRDKMPPVFMSHSVDSGKRSKRSNSERRSDSMTRVLTIRWPIVAREIQRGRQSDDCEEHAACQVQQPQPVRSRGRRVE